MASDTPKHARHSRPAVENSSYEPLTTSLEERIAREEAQRRQASQAKLAAQQGQAPVSAQRPQPTRQAGHASAAVAVDTNGNALIHRHAQQTKSQPRHGAHGSHASASYSTTHAGHTAHTHAARSRRMPWGLPAAAAAAALVVGVGAGSWMLGSHDSAMAFSSASTTGLEAAATTTASYQDSGSSRIVTQLSAEELAAREQQIAAEEAQRAADQSDLEYQKALREAQSHASASMAQMLNVPELYLTQQGSDTCTLCANTMMLRRAAYRQGRVDWEDITESALAPYCWGYYGMSWSYSAFGYEVSQFGLEAGSAEDRLLEIVQLLAEHPEGVVLYDPYVPHAVLAVYYDANEGMLYCADPANTYSGSAIPVTSTWNGDMHGNNMVTTLMGFTQCWCIVDGADTSSDVVAPTSVPSIDEPATAENENSSADNASDTGSSRITISG